VTVLAEQRSLVTSGDLRLEAAIHEGAGSLAAVVLHPHPQYGGDMDNHVVIAVCEALAARGATTLRFNFRGTGASDGSYDGGRGEALDALAAAAHIRSAAPDSRLLLAGYSFGAMIAAGIARDAAPAALLLISPPTSVGRLPDLDPDTPALIIAGDRDQVAPAEAIRTMSGDRHQVVLVPDVDHSWWPGLESLVREIDVFLESLPG
jgi:alpha/beta superfamily hydrolase